MNRELRLNVLKSSLSSLKRLPNVVGGGVGKRIRNNKITDEDVIHVLVSTKIPEDSIHGNNTIPKRLWSNMSQAPIPTDVIQVGHIKLLNNRDVNRPILGGVSIANVNENATGTLGGILKDKTDNHPVLLSNNHVMARVNRAELGERIEQPSRFEGLYGGGLIGSLKRFVRLQSYPAINQVDGAVAEILEAMQANYDINIANAGFIRSILVDPPINKLVQKSGRTSERTIGAIISKDVMVSVDEGSGIYDFDNQILTTQMLSPGDSGSLLLSLKGELVGLGFAGSDDISVFNPINLVLEQLNIEIYDLPVVMSYRDPSHGGFFYKTTIETMHDPTYTMGCGKFFLLYPSSLNTTSTTPLKRWRTKTYPYQYVLATTTPNELFEEHATLGRIRTSQTEDTVPLLEWLHPNGARFYTVDPFGDGAATLGFIAQPNPVGYVSKIENIQFNL